jgi:hypothetical protein
MHSISMMTLANLLTGNIEALGYQSFRGDNNIQSVESKIKFFPASFPAVGESSLKIVVSCFPP